MILLVDNSNSRTKFVRADGEGLVGEARALPTAELGARRLAQLLAGWEWEGAMVASVVPRGAEVLEEFLGREGVHQIGRETKLNFAMAFPRPEQLGADRLANAAALPERGAGPWVVVDLGTAVTFDVLGAKGEFLGGVIAPGVGALVDDLATRTALLPRVELERPEQAIGQSTHQAMVSGSWYGYRGLIRGILAAVREQLGRPVRVVGTGGDAPFLLQGMPEVEAVDELLTLRGVHRLAQCNGLLTGGGKFRAD